MTKHLSLSLLLLLLTLSPTGNASTQEPVSSISSLIISFWPDYDRRSVLVLMTGTLDVDASLPAVVVLPLPASGRLNAVARIDANGRMVDDIQYSSSPGEVTLTTPDPRFRVEYYFPYQVDGNERAFGFSWRAGISVERLDVAVQQPAAADSLFTEPAAVDVVAGDGGLRDHLLPGRAVPAGQTFNVGVRYTVTSPNLSVELFAAEADAPAGAAPQAAGAGEDPGWGVLLGAIGAGLVVAALLWQIGRTRAATATGSPAAQAGAAETSARFCHACGHPIREQDHFCSKCGTALEGK